MTGKIVTVAAMIVWGGFAGWCQRVLADGPPAPYALARTVHVGGEGGWDYVQLSPDANWLYVPRAKVTQIVDLGAGKVVKELPGFTTPHGVALVPGLHRGFISDGDRTGAPGVTVIDTGSLEALGKLKTPADSDGIVYDPASRHVLLVSGDGHSLIPIAADVDPKAGAAEATVDLGGAPEYLAVDGRGHAFVNLQDKNQVAVIDTVAAGGMKVIDRWSTLPGGEPTGMSIDAATHRLFVGCRNPAKLVVMSSDDGKVLASVNIGAVVDATAFDPPYVLASCADGTLSVIKQVDAEHYEDLGKIATAVGARTMTADTQRHMLYLVTADYPPAPKVSGTGKPARPRPLPDTFKILIFSRLP